MKFKWIQFCRNLLDQNHRLFRLFLVISCFSSPFSTENLPQTKTIEPITKWKQQLRWFLLCNFGRFIFFFLLLNITELKLWLLIYSTPFLWINYFPFFLLAQYQSHTLCSILKFHNIHISDMLYSLHFMLSPPLSCLTFQCETILLHFSSVNRKPRNKWSVKVNFHRKSIQPILK